MHVPCLAEKCSFLRSYLVATCSFTKNKTPSQMFFHGVFFLYGETRYSYKFNSSCYLPSADKHDLLRHYSL